MLSFFFPYHCLHSLWTVSDDSIVNPEGEGKSTERDQGKRALMTCGRHGLQA